MNIHVNEIEQLERTLAILKAMESDIHVQATEAERIEIASPVVNVLADLTKNATSGFVGLSQLVCVSKSVNQVLVNTLNRMRNETSIN